MTRGRTPGIAHRIPAPMVRAVLDAGVTVYPDDEVARQRRTAALVDRLEALLQQRRDAQAAAARSES